MWNKNVEYLVEHKIKSVAYFQSYYVLIIENHSNIFDY